MNFTYYGIFVSKLMHNSILEDMKNIIPQGWKIYADHCTLLHCSDKENAKYAPLFEKLLDTKMEMRVTAIGKSDKALALRVEAPSCNKIPHITIAVAPDAKPVESNDITEWTPIQESLQFNIRGTINKR